MKKALFITLGLACVGAAMAAPPPRYVPGEVLLKMKAGQESYAPILFAQVGATELSRVHQIGMIRVKFSTGVSAGVEGVIRSLKRSGKVEYAEPNYYRYATFTPNDAMFGGQYHHPIIRTPQAWDLQVGNPNIKIAILDTGTDVDHPDLQAQIVPGYDFVNDDADPDDDNGHGTHTAGDAAAATNNGIGVAAPGFNCKIMPVKVLAGAGFGTDAWIINGIIFAADQGAHVINMSLGGAFGSTAEQNAVNYAWNRGSVIVASAGNSGNTQVNYPAGYPKCIAVASTDQNDQRSDFSTYGNWVDVAAPGSDIVSTTIGGGYGPSSGTSMSSPVAAGVVGLLWSQAPSGTTNAEIRQYLEDNCDNVGNFVVHGRINAFKALDAVVAYTFVTNVVENGNTTEGTHLGGNDGSFTGIDSDSYAVGTVVIPNLGSVATFTAEADILNPLSEINRMTIEVNASGAGGVTGFMYVWDYQTNKYKHIKSFPVLSTVNATPATQAIPAPLSRYVQGGRVKLAFRAVSNPRRNLPFSFNVDRVAVISRVRL